MQFLNLSVGTVPAKVGEATIPLYRGVVVQSNGQLVDETVLHDSHAEALAEGAKLLALYEEKAKTREKLIGFVSLEGIEHGGCTIRKEPEGAFGVPVYIKLNDYFSTNPVRESGNPRLTDG